MTRFKIDKGIPLNSRNAKPDGGFPFRQMKLGDSFLVPDKKTVVAAKNISVRLGVQIAIRKQEGMKYRVWKVRRQLKMQKIQNVKKKLPSWTPQRLARFRATMAAKKRAKSSL